MILKGFFKQQVHVLQMQYSPEERMLGVSQTFNNKFHVLTNFL